MPLLRFEQMDCRLPVPEHDCVGIQADEPIDREREVRNGFLRPVTGFHEVVCPTQSDSVKYEHCHDGLPHRALCVKNRDHSCGSLRLIVHSSFRELQ